MKRYIHSSTYSENNIITMYHGGKLPTNGFIKDSQDGVIALPDLGLHVGSLEQARSHSDTNIYEVKFSLENVIDVPDQGDWNTPRAVYEILKQAGSPLTLSDVTIYYRENIGNIDTWQRRAKILCSLLIDNGVSVIRYSNTDDIVGGTCYCIVDSSVVIDVEEIEFNLDNEVSGFRRNSKYANLITILPKWVQDRVIDAYQTRIFSGTPFYRFVFRPLEDDPDQHLIVFEGIKREILKQIAEYKNTYNAPSRLTTEQGMRHPDKLRY